MSATVASSSMYASRVRSLDTRGRVSSASAAAAPQGHPVQTPSLKASSEWSRKHKHPSRICLKARCLPSELLLPVREYAIAFAPATVANLGPGFDWMGCAVEGEGDTVEARILEGQPGKVVIEEIVGDGGRLRKEPEENCCGIAALETLAMLPGGTPSCGVSLRLHKGLPLGSGMGSSAASAAAACWAVNNLFGNVLSKEDLVLAGLKSEAKVSGYHADNIAPALMGGFVLIRSADPLDLVRLPFHGICKFVLVTPKFEAPTREMRAVLPAEVPFESMISNNIAGGSLVFGILQGDVPMLGKALNSEIVVEAARGPLIPGFAAVKAAATNAGAYGCAISGAGPTVVAIVDSSDVGERVAAAMSEAFLEHGQLETHTTQIVSLCTEGAKSVDAMPSVARSVTSTAAAAA